MAACTVNITKEIVTHLNDAPLPDEGDLLEVRMGKVGTLGNEPSAIFKRKLEGQIFVSRTGIVGDEHVYHTHGGTERAIHQYASGHYADWRCEAPPKPDLFEYGGFGENFVGTNMNEENVCIGDLYRVGQQVVVQVSEPRSPCSKLNVRFDWPRALKRVQRTGRVGWNMRVLRTGKIQKGDKMVLLDRPNPHWSVMNVKRVIQGKSVPLPLLQELSELEVMTEMLRDLAHKRLEATPKRYRLADAHYVTSRVKQLTFALDESLTITQDQLKPFSFAQIEFGNEFRQSRSYSIVSGNLNSFSLGVALDDHSRGGSAYLHNVLKIGDRITMTPGSSPKAVEDEEKCIKEGQIAHRIIIIGGIGVTAFLPKVKQWETEHASFEVHYAVRSPEEAAYLNRFPANKTTLYAKSQQKRLQVENIIPLPNKDGKYDRKIYCCGPTRLMDACQQRAEDLGYPDHLLHFESFGGDAGGPQGEPFEAQVNDLESGRSKTISVPADKTLLETLRAAGFEVTSFCEVGGCGACKVAVCGGQVEHRGTGLKSCEISSSMLSCVDRGLGKINIELD